MINPSDERLWVATGEQLAEGGYLRIAAAYTGEPISIFVFKYKGRCLAYRNLCVHMPGELDCEKDVIFDATGRYLRCSMHGTVYGPSNGASVSAIRNGQRSTPIGIVEDEPGAWIEDIRVRPLTPAQ
jgi:nitrite reductase/ring-hydroxylating ferredoxin subunit